MSRYRLILSPAQEAVLLRAGSATVRQQALRDFTHAMKAFFDPANPAQRPSWRKAGRDEGFRVALDHAGRWHLAFAAIPASVSAPGNGQVAGIDCGVAVSAALCTGELLHARARRGSQRRGRVRLSIAPLRARETGRAKAVLNREILRSGWGLLVRRLKDSPPSLDVSGWNPPPPSGEDANLYPYSWRKSVPGDTLGA